MLNELTIAAVLKPQGVRGELKLKVYLDEGRDILGVKTLYIDGAPYEVMGGRAQGEFAYISLKGVADRNAAELFRGKEVTALREDLPALEGGRHYIADLIGCSLVAENGELLGKITSITPAKTDIYTIFNGKREITFAAADGVIKSVDVEGGKIVVNKARFKEVSL